MWFRRRSSRTFFGGAFLGFILIFQDQLEFVDGLLDVLAAVLTTVSADPFDDAPLQEGDVIRIDKFNRTDPHIHVMITTDLSI